jgi:hypothetical protein
LGATLSFEKSIRSCFTAVTPHRPDTTPAPAEESSSTLGDPAALAAETPSLGQAPTDADRATRPRPPRRPASRLMTMARSLWIIVRERTK